MERLRSLLVLFGFLLVVAACGIKAPPRPPEPPPPTSPSTPPPPVADAGTP